MKKTIVGMMTSVFCCALLLSDVVAASNDSDVGLDIFDRNQSQIINNQDSTTGGISAFGNTGMHQPNTGPTRLKRSASFSNRQVKPLSRPSRSHSFSNINTSATATHKGIPPLGSPAVSGITPVANSVASPAALSLNNSAVHPVQNAAPAQITEENREQARLNAIRHIKGLYDGVLHSQQQAAQAFSEVRARGLDSADNSAPAVPVSVNSPDQAISSDPSPALRNNVSGVLVPVLPTPSLSPQDSDNTMFIDVNDAASELDTNDDLLFFDEKSDMSNAMFPEGNVQTSPAPMPNKPRYSRIDSFLGKNRAYTDWFSKHMSSMLGDNCSEIANKNLAKLGELSENLTTLKDTCSTIAKNFKKRGQQIPLLNQSNMFIKHDIELINKVGKALTVIIQGSNEKVFETAYKKFSSLKEFRLLTPDLVRQFEQVPSLNMTLSNFVTAMTTTMTQLAASIQELGSFNLPQTNQTSPVYQLGKEIDAILETWKAQFTQDPTQVPQPVDGKGQTNALEAFAQQNSPSAKVRRVAAKVKGVGSKAVQSTRTGLSNLKNVFVGNTPSADPGSSTPSEPKQKKGLSGLFRRH